MLLDMAEVHHLAANWEPLLLVRWMESLVMVEEDHLPPNLAASKVLNQEDQYLGKWTTGQGSQEVSLQIRLVLLKWDQLAQDLVTVWVLSKVQGQVHHQE